MMREIPIEKNDDIEFTIDALGSEGQGIGRVDGYTVFVPLALPGEKIRAHVTVSYTHLTLPTILLV